MKYEQFNGISNYSYFSLHSLSHMRRGWES